MKHTNQLLSGIYKFSCHFIWILSLLFTGILFTAAFLFTCYAEDMTTQQVLTQTDNPLLQLLGTGCFFLLLFICCRLFCHFPQKGKKVLAVLTLGWILFIGAMLILFGRTAPAADAWSVYSAAESLAMGDTSVIHPTDSYLSYYPQQVGLMAFFELLVRLWKLLPTTLEAYHFIKCLYVVLTCVIVFYQYKIVHLLWENDTADCFYLLLAGCNLPMIMYSSFVYGEIPSFAALSMGIFYLVKLLKNWEEHHRVHFFLSLLGLALSVLLRKNSLIAIIAVVLVVLAEWCHRRKNLLLVYTALCLVLSLTVLPITQKIYELRAGNTLKSGVPAMSYFAMGMQESSRGNGWYNGFNFNTYQETGMDTDQTVLLSQDAIAERLTFFKDNPRYTASFYLSKFLSQWTDGTYASRQATLATLGPRHPAVEEFYTGKYATAYISYCNFYQTLLYAACFAALFLPMLRPRSKDTRSLELYPFIGLITAFGGFLFHMLWEANSRYIFLYGLLFIPYAARGLTLISNTFFLPKFRKNNTDRTTDEAQKQPIAG